MKRYRLIEVGCSRELYAIAADTPAVLDERTVARFSIPEGEHPAWMRQTLRAFSDDDPGMRRVLDHVRPAPNANLDRV